MKTFYKYLGLFSLVWQISFVQTVWMPALSADCTYYMWDSKTNSSAVYAVQNQSLVVMQAPDLRDQGYYFIGWCYTTDSSGNPKMIFHDSSKYINYDACIKNIPTDPNSTAAKNNANGCTKLSGTSKNNSCEFDKYVLPLQRKENTFEDRFDCLQPL